MASKKRDDKLFAYEVFMTQATKEGRVRREELSMKVLKPDLSLQARVDHINLDHVRALHEILKNGQTLAPIIVFEIEELKGKVVVQTFKIADGFHRHEVYRKEGLPAIPCIIIKGTLQEAIEYAASANQALSLPRTREDAKKAVFMLFANGWLDRAMAQTARQAGVKNETVAKYRVEYCSRNNLRIPETYIDTSGVVRARHSCRRLKHPVIIEGKDSRGRTEFRARIGGKSVYLGHHKKDAIAKAEKVRAEYVYTKSGFPAACAARNLLILPAWGEGDAPHLSGYKSGWFSVALWRTNTTGELLIAIATVLLMKSELHLKRMAVVRPEYFETSNSVLAAARRLGVEFMSLDEFVAAVKADEASQAEGRAS